MKDRHEGQAEELEEGLRTIAKRMLEEGDTAEKVAKVTGLTVAVVSQIDSQMRTDRANPSSCHAALSGDRCFRVPLCDSRTET